jgi:3-carboxy-cis,cis-muconate cycloisomerase
LTSSSGELFGALFVPADAAAAVGDRAWLVAMLEFEAALAGAEAEAGVIPADAASAIAAACDPDRFDAAELGRAGHKAANPAAPLVTALTEAVGEEAGAYVHWGATSQDVLDSAAMLVAKRSLAGLDGELAACADACAKLAGENRETVMVARTLLQQALPTTFGCKAAGWLVALLEARRRLAAIPLPVQLGGAAGTLAALGDEGPRVLELLSKRLELDQPLMPWHTARSGVAELGSALALAAGCLAKIALDVKLLAQTEVGEAAEASSGGSSTMPQKRNPTGSIVTLACWRRVRAEAAILLEAMAQEHERAAGAWQSEWEALSNALAYTGGAAAAGREMLEGLEVDAERMRSNLDAGGGQVMAESVSLALARDLGRGEAQRLVAEASRRALESGQPLREELLADEQVAARLAPEQLDAALDPSGYLGATDLFVDRALEAWKASR